MKHTDKTGHIICSSTRTLNIDRNEGEYTLAITRKNGLKQLTITNGAGNEVLSLSLVPFSDQIEAVKQGMIGGNEIIANIVDVESSRQGVHVYKDSRMEVARFLVDAVKEQMKDRAQTR